jgi:hypothetical protein
LAFQEAAGTSGSLFFCLPLESSMRLLILIAGALALAACGNNDQTDNTQNVDENLTAENIVSNDVTAIDAVTGDAANMAAESDINDIGAQDVIDSGNMSSPTKPTARRPTKPTTPDEPTTGKVSTAGNSAE